ncbi:MAG: iron-sulfur cluster carrier protein ApbC [Woeseiaceae bacterium]|nr:iron-sulfur cluster carrier protein ApbC [Woeseiaceae bacterium]
MDPKNNIEITELLHAVAIPDTEVTLRDVGRVKSVEISDSDCFIVIELGFHIESEQIFFQNLFSKAVSSKLDNRKVRIKIDSHVEPHGVQPTLAPINGVKNIIAIASGKGGVGKSTTAANMALALHQDGARVGVLDADIYGPSQPLIFGIENEQPTSKDGKSMNPLIAYGIQIISIGFLIDAKQPMVWRGPMVTSALNQLLKQTLWDNLDYLIVDMPPGTGDIQLTLSQQVPVSGAVIVTTPQDIALLDARKGLQMFRKVSVPILGIVENMSTHICSNCQHEEAIFGIGGGSSIAEEFDINLLCNIPLNHLIRKQTDEGTPSVIADPESDYACRYLKGARQMAVKLATKKKDYSQHFPNIVIEES